MNDKLDVAPDSTAARVALWHEVAEPFGLAPNALALDAITRTIERSILELCGREIPDEIAPVRPYQFT